MYKRHALYDIGAIRAARAEGVPLVLEVNRPYSAHSYYEFEPLKFVRAAARLERTAFNDATLIVVVSTPLKSFVLNNGVPAQKVLLTPNGANPVRFVDQPHEGAAIRERLGVGDAMLVDGLNAGSGTASTCLSTRLKPRARYVFLLSAIDLTTKVEAWRRRGVELSGRLYRL